MQTEVKKVRFEGKDMKLEQKILNEGLKPTWIQVK